MTKIHTPTFAALLARLPAIEDVELAELARGFARVYLDALNVSEVLMGYHPNQGAVVVNDAFWQPCPGQQSFEAHAVESLREICGEDHGDDDDDDNGRKVH